MLKHSDQRQTDTYGKELWIFWYGDQPSVLEELLPPNLKGNCYICILKYMDTHLGEATLPFPVLPPFYVGFNFNSQRREFASFKAKVKHYLEGFPLSGMETGSHRSCLHL